MDNLSEMNKKFYDLFYKLDPNIKKIKQIVCQDEIMNYIPNIKDKTKYKKDTSLLYTFSINQIISKNEQGFVKVANYDVIITLGFKNILIESTEESKEIEDTQKIASEKMSVNVLPNQIKNLYFSKEDYEAIGLSEKNNKMVNLTFFQTMLINDPHKIKNKNCTPTKRVFKCNKRYFGGSWCSRCFENFERSAFNCSYLLDLKSFNQIPFDAIIHIIERDVLYLTNFNQ